MENTNLQTKSNKKIKLDFKESKYATGRRKTSVARIWLKKGSGNIYVNGVKMLAIIHGLSRALVQYNIDLKKILKKEKFMTRDSREVERKKYGHRKARRSFQFSKR